MEILKPPKLVKYDRCSDSDTSCYTSDDESNDYVDNEDEGVDFQDEQITKWKENQYDYFTGKHFKGDETTFRQKLIRTFYFADVKVNEIDEKLESFCNNTEHVKKSFETTIKNHTSNITTCLQKEQNLNIQSIALLHSPFVYMLISNLPEHVLVQLNRSKLQGKYLYHFFPDSIKQYFRKITGVIGGVKKTSFLYKCMLYDLWRQQPQIYKMLMLRLSDKRFLLALRYIALSRGHQVQKIIRPYLIKEYNDFSVNYNEYKTDIVKENNVINDWLVVNSSDYVVRDSTCVVEETDDLIDQIMKPML